MRYRIDFTVKARKQLDTIAEPYRTRIIRVVEALAVQPRSQSAEKLSGYDLYRIRVGGYRVIYAIHEQTVTVSVTAIGRRGSIYGRL